MRRRRPRRSIAILLVASALLVLAPQAATAHEFLERDGGYVYGSGAICVHGYGEVNHSWHWIRTTVTKNSCQEPLLRDATYIKQRQEYYRSAPGGQQPYTLCMVEPYWREWSQNSRPAYEVVRVYNPVVLNQIGGCMNSGPNVIVTMDTWHKAAYDVYWYPSPGGGAFRPLAWHCFGTTVHTYC